MHKLIKFPAPISVPASRKFPAVTITADAMMVTWLEDLKIFGKTLETLELRREIRQKWEKVEKNGSAIEFELTKKEHALLSLAARQPTNPYDPHVGDHAISMIYAVTDAETRD